MSHSNWLKCWITETSWLLKKNYVVTAKLKLVWHMSFMGFKSLTQFDSVYPELGTTCLLHCFVSQANQQSFCYTWGGCPKTYDVVCFPWVNGTCHVQTPSIFVTTVSHWFLLTTGQIHIFYSLPPAAAGPNAVRYTLVCVTCACMHSVRAWHVFMHLYRFVPGNCCWSILYVFVCTRCPAHTFLLCFSNHTNIPRYYCNVL